MPPADNAAADMTEVSHGLHTVRDRADGRDNSVYVWMGDEQLLIVDTGYVGTPARLVAPLVRRWAPGLPVICVITHGDVDHFGGAAELAALIPRVVLACHEADRRWITSVECVVAERYREFAGDGLDRPPDSLERMRAAAVDAPVRLTLHGGERFDLGGGRTVEVLHVPGHTPGSVALFDRANAILVVGDAVLAEGINDVRGRRAMPPTYRDVDRYVDSIQRLRALEPSAIHTSHLGSFTGDAVIDVLDRSVRHVERFDQHLLDALATRGPVSLRELAEYLMSRIGPWPAPLATFAMPVAAHIDRIVARGLATVEAHRGLNRYRIAS